MPILPYWSPRRLLQVKAGLNFNDYYWRKLPYDARHLSHLQISKLQAAHDVGGFSFCVVRVGT